MALCMTNLYVYNHGLVLLECFVQRTLCLKLSTDSKDIKRTTNCDRLFYPDELFIKQQIVQVPCNLNLSLQKNVCWRSFEFFHILELYMSTLLLNSVIF